MKVLGTIESLGSKNQITEKFAKQEVIIVTEDKYPQTLCVQFANDNISKLAQFKVNDLVEISINIQGRKWEAPDGVTKYFTSLDGWSIGLAGSGSLTPMSPADLHHKKGKVIGNIERRFEDDAIDSMNEDDDLPF
mgnify:CR=1 FL=1|tara:strand:- start:2153 stop:2557 length:405 start_codon:yes stop_codon:yes gene_type:complete